MTRTPEEMDVAITRIEAILGSWTQTIGQLRPTRPPELPNQFYPIDKSMQQLYDSENALNVAFDWVNTRLMLAEAKISATVTPVPIPPASSVSAGTVDLPGFGNGFHFKKGAWECMMFISDYDFSMRILTNHKDNDAGGFTHAIETMAQQRIDIERFAIGISYWPPRRRPDGSMLPLTDLDKRGGKSLVIKPGGQDDEGHRGKYVQIYAGLPGQGLQIGVSPTTANSMDSPSIQIEPDGTVSKS